MAPPTPTSLPSVTLLDCTLGSFGPEERRGAMVLELDVEASEYGTKQHQSPLPCPFQLGIASQGQLLPSSHYPQQLLFLLWVISPPLAKGPMGARWYRIGGRELIL